MISYSDLKKYSKMLNPEDIKLFEKGVWEWSTIKDELTLKKLLALFDENCEFPEVMYGLVHAVETYPEELYVRTLLNELNTGIKNYPSWYLRLITPVLNTEHYQKIFSRNIKFYKKTSLLELFDLLDEESPHHRELIAKLRNEVLKRKE